MIQWIFFVSFFFGFGTARAGIIVRESLDWLTLSCPHIAVGEVTTTRDEKHEKALWMNESVEIIVTEVLKGFPPKRAVFSRHIPVNTSPRKSKDEFLLFFKKDGIEIHAVAALTTQPLSSLEAAITKDFKVLREKNAILGIIRDRLKHGPMISRSFRREVPENTEAFKSLWSGSACFIVVPADPEFKEDLLKSARSGEVWTRAKATYRLSNYPGEEITKILRVFLNDSSRTTMNRGSDQHGKVQEVMVFPVRQAAFQALQSMGVKVEKPEGYDDKLPENFFEF